MEWLLSNRADPEVVPLADRHYSRRTVGSPQFVPPGRCCVFKTRSRDAFWVTSWPYAEFVRHAWPGAWVCSAFRNEGSFLSSLLIRQALAATRWALGEPPQLGMITFVDAGQVKRKRDPGRCFLRAGFVRVGQTKGGLITLQITPADMPAALRAQEESGQAYLFDEV